MKKIQRSYLKDAHLSRSQALYKMIFLALLTVGLSSQNKVFEFGYIKNIYIILQT
jgi:hypothetical protein